MPVPRSEIYDDVYFSKASEYGDGLAETRHVFLDSNDLPAAWDGRDDFVIAETGFGTGLNFFAVWDLFEKTAAPDATLHFISFEKHPLKGDIIRGALAPWAGEFGDKVETFLAQYPMLIPGFHRIDVTPQISVTLIFDDVNNAMRKVPAGKGGMADCWFLDGFRPATNPDMWSEIVFQEMARLSKKDARFATFTAAGDVKRGLQAAGFETRKISGFGRKREMLVGAYKGAPS